MPLYVIICANLVLLFSLLQGQAMCQTFTLSPATPIAIRILTEVSSEEGSLVQAVVDRPVTTPTGTVLIAANAPVELVAQKQRSRGIGKPGSVRLYPVKTFATDNQPILLNGGTEATGKARKGRAWSLAAGTFVVALTGGIIMAVAGFNTALDDDGGLALSAVGAGIATFSPLCWLFLLKHGEPAHIPAGTVIENIYPRQSYTVNLER